MGASVAYALALRDIAREIVLIDIDKEKTAGEAWDIRHGIPSMGTADLYAGDYSDCADCDTGLNTGVIRPTILPVSSKLMGEHGVRDVALSVPSVVGPMGVQQRIREKWAPEEYRAFFDAVERIRRVLQEVENQQARSGFVPD